MANAKAPFPWFGGKQYLVPTLLELLPPHDVYVEVFGGAASLLFGKTASKVEVYNDLDSGLVNFFRVLRDENRSRELRRLLDLTPYAREEWEECRAGWWRATSDVEMARQWYFAVLGSFGKHIAKSTGWSFSKTPGHDKAHSYRSACDSLPNFTRRLQYVQVEHGDFARILHLYDSERTLFYCDPPYVRSTRGRADRYRHEMSDEEHLRLIADLRELQGMVVLSGYRSDLYDGQLADWRRVDVPVYTRASHTTRASRVECIWISPNATKHQPQLPFEAESEVAAS